jgi:hypothetical protein
VVIGIITVLITLTAAATIRFIATQQVKNTEATIYKVDSEFRRQWAEVVKTALTKENPCLTAQTLANFDPKIARIIHVKLRLKQEFPMSYYEVFHQDPTLPPIQEYIDKLNQAGVFDVGSISPPPPQLPYAAPDENSACLVMALQRSRGGKGTNLDDLLGPGIAGSTSTQTIVPTPGSVQSPRPLTRALPIIIDAWESPIVFYRWPTGNADVDGSGPGLNSVPAVRLEQRDPQDPEGTLQDLQTWWPTLHVQFEQLCHSVSKVQNGQNGPYAYYLVPVIASAGPDRVLGIQPISVDQPDPMQIAIQNNENDNLYSYRLRLGGKGD